MDCDMTKEYRLLSRKINASPSHGYEIETKKMLMFYLKSRRQI